MTEKPIVAGSQTTAGDTGPPDQAGSGDAVRRRRLRFRCWHRGTREADLLLGSFADRYIDRFDSTALDRLEALLEHSDPDIYDWITDRAAPSPECDTDVMALLRNHKDSFAKQ